MSTLGEKMTGRARHEMCVESGVERTKENSMKLELVCPWGDKGAYVRGMIFHYRMWDACVLRRGLGMSSGCLEVQQNHMA